MTGAGCKRLIRTELSPRHVPGPGHPGAGGAAHPEREEMRGPGQADPRRRIGGRRRPCPGMRWPTRTGSTPSSRRPERRRMPDGAPVGPPGDRTVQPAGRRSGRVARPRSRARPCCRVRASCTATPDTHPVGAPRRSPRPSATGPTLMVTVPDLVLESGDRAVRGPAPTAAIAAASGWRRRPTSTAEVPAGPRTGRSPAADTEASDRGGGSRAAGRADHRRAGAGRRGAECVPGQLRRLHGAGHPSRRDR